MQKFFISDTEYAKCTLNEEHSYQLIRVLRCRLGNEFLIGYDEVSYLAKITAITAKEISYEIVSTTDGNSELPFFVVLFQGYPKGDKLEDIIKMSTQLGIKEIRPVLMQRSIVKIEPAKIAGKVLRFNKIAKEASEQALRNSLVEVFSPQKPQSIDFSSYDVKILCYEDEAKTANFIGFKAIVKNLKKGDRVAVVVGPEGGITKDEVQYFISQGFISVGLGPRIMRTEMTINYVLSAISYEFELK